MAYKCELTDGVTTIDLYYNATGWSILDEGFKPGLPEQISTYGGLAGTVLARHYDGRRAIPLTLFLEGTSDDDLVSRLNGLILLLRQAQNYHLDGFGSAVYLDFKLSGATNTTRFRVLRGSVDIDRIMSMFCKNESVIDQVPVFVECEPYWEATADVDLENLLDNPGFEEWHSGTVDSQPDGWDDIEWFTAGTGSNNRESTEKKQGLFALRIEVSGIDDENYKGVEQDILSRLTPGMAYTLIAWVKNAAIPNGLVVIWVDGDVSGTTRALESGEANAEYTRYTCTFTPHVDDTYLDVDVFIYAMPPGGCTGTAYIDRMMVIPGSTVPTAWMSSSYLYNHYDSDPGHVNYIDVEDVPGEVDALANILAKVTSKGWSNIPLASLRVGRRYRSIPSAFQQMFNAVDGVVGADTTLGAAAHYPGGQRATCTFATMPGFATRLYWTISVGNLPYNTGKFRVFLIGESDTGTSAVHIRATTGGNETYDGPVRDIGGIGGTRLFDMGILLTPPASLPQSENYDRTVLLEIRATEGTAANIYFGSLVLMPVEEGFGIANSPDIASADMVAVNEYVFIEGLSQPARAYKLTNSLSAYRGWTLVSSGIDVLKPYTSQRLFFVFGTWLVADEDIYTLDVTMKVTLTFRTRGVTLRGPT